MYVCISTWHQTISTILTPEKGVGGSGDATDVVVACAICQKFQPRQPARHLRRGFALVHRPPVDHYHRSSWPFALVAVLRLRLHCTCAVQALADVVDPVLNRDCNLWNGGTATSDRRVEDRSVTSTEPHSWRRRAPSNTRAWAEEHLCNWGNLGKWTSSKRSPQMLCMMHAEQQILWALGQRGDRRVVVYYYCTIRYGWAAEHEWTETVPHPKRNCEEKN